MAPLVLIATPGASNANSYATEAESLALVDSLWPRRPAWEAASADDRNRTLAAATVQLDRLTFVGQAATTTQALEWPRFGTDVAFYGYDAVTIPIPVKTAQIHLGLWLLEQPGDPVSGAAAVGLTSISFGSELSMSFGGLDAGTSPFLAFISASVLPVLNGLVRIAQPRMVRG